MPSQLNLLTVDLEEWFVAETLASRLGRDEWERLPSTVVRNSRRLLELFALVDVRATWFVLGWCAERFPELIREIARAGHEVACHGYYHRRINSMSREEFRNDTRRAVEMISAATGRRPVGYRAPSWSVSPEVAWAFDVLIELGFEYDSSIFPIKHDMYGIPDGPRDFFRMAVSKSRQLWEFPASTYRLFGRNIPIGGGGYLRHSPYWYSRRMIRRVNRQGRPVVVYVHPWEFDPEPPRLANLNAVQRLRMYGSTGTFLQKMQRLLSDFECVAMSDYIRQTSQRRIGFER
jgi:polysaccharide deacetylase family protein (PEP-CTERM system associated)